MIRKLSRCLAGLVLIGCIAKTADASVGLTGKIGTLGFGGDLVVGVSPQLKARLGYNVLDLTLDGGEVEWDSRGQELDTEVEWESTTVLVDWHPAATGFRFTGGLIFNNNEATAASDEATLYAFNDRDYELSRFYGALSFNEVAPFFGMGVGVNDGLNARWHFSLDVGVMFQGEPDVTIRGTAASRALQDRLDEDIAEEVKRLKNDVDNYKYYPVVAVGVTVLF